MLMIIMIISNMTMPMLMLMDKKMVMMYYWFESMSRPPEIDQPKVRRLGVFKSAAMITWLGFLTTPSLEPRKT